MEYLLYPWKKFCSYQKVGNFTICSPQVLPREVFYRISWNTLIKLTLYHNILIIYDVQNLIISYNSRNIGISCLKTMIKLNCNCNMAAGSALIHGNTASCKGSLFFYASPFGFKKYLSFKSALNINSTSFECFSQHVH